LANSAAERHVRTATPRTRVLNPFEYGHSSSFATGQVPGTFLIARLMNRLV
jgi:hypothetical protein